MYNAIELIYYSSVVLEITLECYFIDIVSLYFDHRSSWYDVTDSDPPKTTKPRPATNVRPLPPYLMLLIPSLWWLIVVLQWVWPSWPYIVRYWPWHVPPYITGCTRNLRYFGWLLCQYELATHRGLKDLFLCPSSAGFNAIHCCLLLCLLLGCRSMSSHTKFHRPKSNENHGLLVQNECHFQLPQIESALS